MTARGTISQNRMNEQIFLFLHSFANRSEFLDSVIVFLAEYLPYVVIVGAILFLWLHTDKTAKEKLREVWVTLLTSVTAYVSAILLKILFAADRPFVALRDITPLFLKHDYAFPSGHATFFGALAMAVFLKHKRAGVWFFVAGLLISAARVAAGAHFPGDILGGFILGAGIAYFLRNV